MSRSRRLAGLTEELRRSDNTPGDKVLRIVQRGLVTLRLTPRVEVNRCVLVELTAPPPATRGFADLVVRRAEESELDAVCAIDAADPALVRRRFAQGDLGFVGQLDDELVCHTWFHRGPTPFEEDRSTFTLWGVDASTFWSFHGVARKEFRSSGLFAKLFQVALRQLFQEHGAKRVQGCIHHVNDASRAMHTRLGFTVPGMVTTVALPSHKWVRWDGQGRTRSWLVERDGDFTLSIPPA